MDGNVKMSKNVRGYDDEQEELKSVEENT